MWEYIEGNHEDISWIATALFDSSAIMVTDRSYKQSHAPRISRVGWILFSSKSLQMVYGSFYKDSADASSYREELLGHTVIHPLVAHVMEKHIVQQAMGIIHCDNKGACYQAS